MEEDDVYGSAGELVNLSRTSRVNTVKQTVLLTLADCLLHTPNKPGENELVACMKCTGPNTFYNLYSALVQRENRYSRTNDVWEVLQTHGKFKYLVHGFRKALRNVRKMQRVDPDMFGGCPDTHSARLATLKFKDVSAEDISRLFKKLQNAFPKRKLFLSFNGVRTIDELIQQTVAYTKKARLIWSYCRFVVPTSWVLRRQREIAGIYTPPDYGYAGASRTSSRTSSRAGSPGPVPIHEVLVKPKPGEISLQRMREVLLGYRPVRRHSRSPRKRRRSRVHSERPIKLAEKHHIPKYGVIDEESRMRIRNISVRRNHSVSMSDIDFGDDANSARVYLALHVKKGKLSASLNGERFFKGPPCPESATRHPRLPQYPIKEASTGDCVACQKVIYKNHSQNPYLKSDFSTEFKRQAAIPEIFQPYRRRLRRRVSTRPPSESGTESEIEEPVILNPSPKANSNECAAYEVALAGGRTIFLARSVDGSIRVK